MGRFDPEWWVYNRCGFLGQNELEYYLPDHCTLDGAGNLKLTAEKLSYTGLTYPSDGNRVVTQPWRSGACQSNARTWTPSAGNTMTFEVREQSCHDVVLGMWPGLLWLEGQDYLTAWKTDPQQSGFANPGKAEIDVAEFNPRQGLTTYDNNYSDGSSLIHSAVNGPDISAAMHVYSVRWKPSVSLEWLRDGSRTTLATTKIMTSATRFFLMLYLQIEWGCTATATQSCYVDYVRVYDQNLG